MPDIKIARVNIGEMVTAAIVAISFLSDITFPY